MGVRVQARCGRHHRVYGNSQGPPDGYTIGGLNCPHIILQPLAQNAQFTPDSFKYICQVVNDPQCIAVRKDSPYQSTSEIIAAARKNPGKIRVGLVGPLSGHHLMFLDYGKKYPDAKLTSVFYKGAADQNAALLGGEIDMIFGNINDVMRSIDEFRVLNVAAEKRNDFLPDVPTLREAGIDMVSDIRRCFAAPKGIKPAELDALRVLFKKICEDPEYLADMKKAGSLPNTWTAKLLRPTSPGSRLMLKRPFPQPDCSRNSVSAPVMGAERCTASKGRFA